MDSDIYMISYTRFQETHPTKMALGGLSSQRACRTGFFFFPLFSILRFSITIYLFWSSAGVSLIELRSDTQLCFLNVLLSNLLA